MNPIEESLRRALEGGDPSDPVFRQSIYAASERAMERMIDGRGLDEERANAERVRLGEVMERVESEYAAYYESAAAYGTNEHARLEEGVETWQGEPASWDEADGGAADPLTEAEAMREPARAPASFAAPAATPLVDEEGKTWTPGSSRTSGSGSGRAGAGRKIAVVVLAVLVLAALVYAASLLFSSETAQAPSAATPSISTSETPEVVAPDAPPEDLAWINIFSGSELEQIATPDGGRVESVAEAERGVVRISGPEGAEGEILINIGPGLIGELAGSDVRIELVAGSPDDSLREFSVRCVFGEASICDRQRFATAMGEEAFVFDVTVPADVSTPANLAIDPGLSPEGRDLDLYSVRLRIL